MKRALNEYTNSLCNNDKGNGSELNVILYKASDQSIKVIRKTIYRMTPWTIINSRIDSRMKFVGNLLKKVHDSSRFFDVYAKKREFLLDMFNKFVVFMILVTGSHVKLVRHV